MFPSAAHMTSLFRTLLPRLMPAARLIIKKEYHEFFVFRHPTITFSIESQCMRAQEHQILWSKDVLDGIVLRRYVILKGSGPSCYKRGIALWYWISFYPVDHIVGFPYTY